MPAAPTAADQACLERELSAGREQPLLAIRHGHRWVQRFTRSPIPDRAGPPPRLRDRAVVFLAGGLGSVGLEIAHALARARPVRLSLAGRRTLPPREQWDEVLARLPAEDPQRRQLEKVRAIEASGAEVLLLSVDATDPASLTRGLEATQERTGIFGRRRLLRKPSSRFTPR